MAHKIKPAAPTAYTGKAARDYDRKRFTSAAGRAIAATEHRFLNQTLGLLAPGSRVLEVGCGTGRLLRSACEQGFACEGLDASPDMIEQTRHQLEPDFPQVGLHVGDAAHLPFASATFDFAYSIRLLNQTGSVEHALAIVQNMLRAIRPGGLALVEFVNHYRPKHGGRIAGGDVYLRPRDVVQAAELAGGKPVWVRGAFFLGMTAQHRTPDRLRPLLSAADTSMSRLAPRLCARCYALFQKAPA